ncbi:MAG: DUF6496 domain-containing protein [Myxococcota bacterium]
MPEKKTLERAEADLRAGKSPSTAAGEFVKQEIDHIREGKHGARSTKQAIAIGLSEARRAGIPIAPPAAGTVSERTRKRAERDAEVGAGRAKAPSAKRSAASKKALQKEPRKAASKKALSEHAKAAAPAAAKTRAANAEHEAKRSKKEAAGAKEETAREVRSSTPPRRAGEEARVMGAGEPAATGSPSLATSAAGSRRSCRRASTS